MRRAPLAGAALVVWIGTADAGGTRKVEVESDPSGATVYLNDIDSGAACDATPCTIDAPIGTTPIIIRKDGFNPEITELEVARRGRLKPFKITLTSATATLVISNPALKGGTILVDDIEKGNAPQRLDVEAGPHHVAVVIKGRSVADEIVDLEPGDEHVLEPADPGTVADAGAGGGGSNDDTGGGSDAAAGVVKHAEPEAARPPYITVGADLDIGFRQFSYDNSQNLAATESEAGQTLLGPAVELWPFVMAGSHHLRGFSLFGKVGFGLNHQQVLDSMNAEVATTFWGNIEVDARHRWTIGDDSGVTLEGGFVRDQLQFNASSKTQLDKVPVADYRSIRIGARASTMLGALEPFAAIEGRIVLSGGELATRFASADITGGRVAVGASLVAGPVYVRAQGALTYYGWTFTNTTADPMASTADGATDVIEVLSLMIGLAH